MGALAGPVVAAALWLAFPAAALAQGGRVLLAGGVDGFLRDGDTRTVQPAAHVGYELPRRGILGRLDPRIRLRAGVDFTTQRFGASVVRVNGEPVQTLDRAGRATVFGAALLGSYALAHGRVAPYLVGGGGLYALVSDRRGQTATGAPADERVRRVSPALSAGVGLSTAVGRGAVFGEARLTYLATGVGGTPRTGRGVLVPLVVGVRF